MAIASAARTGQGIAVGLERGGHVATCAEVAVCPDDRVAVTGIITAYDCGTTSRHGSSLSNAAYAPRR